MKIECFIQYDQDNYKRYLSFAVLCSYVILITCSSFAYIAKRCNMQYNSAIRRMLCIIQFVKLYLHLKNATVAGSKNTLK